MPIDKWGSRPKVSPHGYGYSIPVGVVEVGDGSEESPSAFEGIRVEVRSLASIDVEAGIDADPDADESHVAEALALALDVAAPTIQGQLDELTDLILGGM